MANITIDDLKECIEIYGSRPEASSASPVRREYALRTVSKHIQSGAFFDVIKIDGHVRSFMMAVETQQFHSGYPELHACYVASKAGTAVAMRDFLELHKRMMEFAGNRYYALVSSSGPLDKSLSLARLLEKLGWRRVGYTSRFEIPDWLWAGGAAPHVRPRVGQKRPFSCRLTGTHGGSHGGVGGEHLRAAESDYFQPNWSKEICKNWVEKSR